MAYAQGFSPCPVKLGGRTAAVPPYCKCQLPLRSGDVSSCTKKKIGCRPIRLSVSERRAYDLARKKGYLVRYTRNQPLANVYHNYCDKLGWPYIYIHQEEGKGKENRVVMDLRTLRLPESDLEELCRLVVQALEIPKVNYPPRTLEIAKEIVNDIPLMKSKMEAADHSVDEEPSLGKLNTDEAGSGTSRNANLVLKEPGGDEQETPYDPSKIKGLLCFRGTINQTTTMCEVSLHTCKAFLLKKGIQLAKTWWKESSIPALHN